MSRENLQQVLLRTLSLLRHQDLGQGLGLFLGLFLDRGSESEPCNILWSHATMPLNPAAKLCTGHCHGGKPCQNPAIRDRNTCRMHRGHAKRGAAHPQYQGKGYSKDLPTALADDYLRAREDPRVTELSDSIALLDTRLRQLLRRAQDESLDLGSIWLQVRSNWAQFHKARASGDTDLMRLALEEHDGLLKRGEQDYLLWRDIVALNMEMSKLRIAEHRRLVDLKVMVPAEQVLLLIGEYIRATREVLLQVLPQDQVRPTLQQIRDRTSAIDVSFKALPQDPDPGASAKKRIRRQG